MPKISYKNVLMQYEIIWKRIRFLNRKLTGLRLDKQFQDANLRVSIGEYNEIKKYFNEEKKKILDEIEDYKKINFENYSFDIMSYGTITIDNIKFISGSGDQMGKVFYYNGAIYRGIFERSVNDFFVLWKTGILQVLANKCMIPQIELTNYRTDEFPIILKVRKVNIQNNSYWNYAMIKDACLLTAFIKEIIEEKGYTLLDGHPNNITFHKARPVFVDVGSIIPKRQTGASEELVFSGLYRLIFGILNNSILYRLPTHDIRNTNIFIKPRYFTLMTREYRHMLHLFKKHIFFHGSIAAKIIVHNMFDYYSIKACDIEALFTSKNVGSIIEEIKIPNDIMDFISDCETLLDVGGCAGYIVSFISMGIKFKFIKFVDFDEKRLESVYLYMKNREVDCEISLLNVLYTNYIPTLQEFSSDVVFCKDPLINSGFYNDIDLTAIVNALTKFSIRKVVIIYTLNSVQNEDKMKKMIGLLNEFFLIEVINPNELIRYICGSRIQDEEN